VLTKTVLFFDILLQLKITVLFCNMFIPVMTKQNFLQPLSSVFLLLSIVETVVLLKSNMDTLMNRKIKK